MQLEYEIAALIAMIGLSGYFSGLEVALVSIRLSKIEQMVKDKVRGAVSLHKLKSNPSRMMSSVNLGNNLASIAATALATDISLKLFGDEGLDVSERFEEVRKQKASEAKSRFEMKKLFNETQAVQEEEKKIA